MNAKKGLKEKYTARGEKIKNPDKRTFPRTGKLPSMYSDLLMFHGTRISFLGPFWNLLTLVMLKYFSKAMEVFLLIYYFIYLFNSGRGLFLLKE